MRGSSKWSLWLSVVAVVPVLLAGCGGTPGEDREDEPAAASGGSSKTMSAEDIEALGPVTLDVWAGENDPGQKATTLAFAEKFEQAHPNVTVDVTHRPFDSYSKTIKLKLSSDDAPDVAQGNMGYGIDGELVKAGLIRPLDEHADAYGWTDAFDAGTLESLSWSEDGKEFGGPILFGIAGASEAVGMYYNVDKLAELGFDEPPKTLEELEQVMAAAAEAGETAIQLGNQDGWPGTHIWAASHTMQLASDELRDITTGRVDTYKTPENVAAADRVRAWVDAGYFPKDVNGKPYDVGLTDFAKGDGVFNFTGTWATKTIEENLGDGVNLGFANVPVGESGKLVGTGATSLPWHISTASEQPDLAAAFINSMVDPESAAGYIENNRVPATGVEGDPPSGLLGQTITAWDELAEAEGVAFYPDWVTPTMFTTMVAGASELLGAKSDGQSYIDKVDEDYQKFKAEQAG